MNNKVEWRKFKVKDIFQKSNIKKYSSEPETNGNIPYITSSSINNGISKFVELHEEMETIDNCITISTNGRCFDCFYQKFPCYISTDVEVLKNENLNVKISLFLISILKKEQYRYGYGRKPKNNKVFETEILLPAIKVDNKYIPNWKYMEEYIDKLEEIKSENNDSIKNSLKTNNYKKNHIKANNCFLLSKKKFKSFKLKNLFDSIYKAKAYVKSELKISEYPINGYVPFISRTENNNACDCYVPLDEIDNLEAGNAIIIGDTTATTFYQKNSFATGDHIVVCRANWMNLYTALFIKTLIDKEKYRYNYGRAFKMEFIENTEIQLPILTKNEEIIIDNNNTFSEEGFIPDWEFIENYIKSLPFADKI